MNLAGVIVSFIITWGLGLSPALLARYVFFKKPIDRRTAGWLAASSSLFFWFVFLLLNTALGQRPGNGMVWVLMFFLSRWIMTDGDASRKARL